LQPWTSPARFVARSREPQAWQAATFFTTNQPNPTLSTLIRLAAALGYRVELVRDAALADCSA